MQHMKRFFSALKIKNFIGKILIFLLKTLIVGTCYKRVAKAVLTSTHNLCFGSKIKKIGIELLTPVLLYKGYTFHGQVFS